MSGVDPTYRYEYISVRERVAGVWGRFSTPKLHSYYAKDATGGGGDGTSGYRVEFIYKLVADESAIDSVEKPSYKNEDKYKPAGWERTPQGVSPSKQVELMCQREKDGDTWRE